MRLRGYHIGMIGLGLVYLLLTFFACFAVVHIIKLTVVGFLSVKRKKPPEQPPPKKPEVKKEPVYYIVERKRAKKTYSEPREIKFKE